MPIVPPRLDDRAFPDLVAELLARIPAHTPEYAHPRPGDPGHTLIELFAWLTDLLLYRVNFIPERQRLEFLRMVGVSLRGPRPAEGIVALALKDLDKPELAVEAVPLQAWARVQGAVPFESRRPMTLLPVQGPAWLKRRLLPDEQDGLGEIIDELVDLYQLGTAQPRAYVTTPAFPGNQAVPTGLDIVAATIDGCLWLSLLAGRTPRANVPGDDPVGATRAALGATPDGRRQVLSVGVVLAEEADDTLAELVAAGASIRRPVPVVWELTSGRSTSRGPEYLPLEVLRDGTEGMTRSGTVDLVLPPTASIGAPQNDVRADIDAGVGPRPPRLDDDDLNDRLVAWLRLRPRASVDRLPLTWVGINAVEIDQRRTFTDVVIGTSTGAPDQRLALPGGGVERSSFRLQVDEAGRGWSDWRMVEHTALAAQDEPAFALDDDEGIVQLGDGLHGRIPDAGQRVRVRFMRAGGGTAGNLPPRQLKGVTARRADTGGALTRPVEVVQPVATRGGAQAETLAEAERRIPAMLRHRNRAVTVDDVLAVAASTPAVRLGRVEVLKGFKPHQRRSDVPGVVSVMVLPAVDGLQPPNPRPARHTIEAVHTHLAPRMPLASELYVIGVEYVPIGIAVAFELREGFVREEAVNAVRAATRRLLWPLPPGGPFEDARGWPRGRPVRERELEVAVARVPGVDEVIGIRLFTRDPRGVWSPVAPGAAGGAEITLDDWQLPELLKLVVLTDTEVPGDLEGTDELFDGTEVGVPVVPEVC